MNRSFLVAVVVASACTPPPPIESPTLAEVLPQLFARFDVEDGAELPAIVAQLELALADADVDVDGPSSERQFTLHDPDLRDGGGDPLGADQLGGARPPPETDPERQIAVVAFGRSPEDFATNVDVALEPNQVCIESDTTVYYARTYLGDVEAFRNGTVAVLASTNEVRKELSFLAAGWYDLYKDFRRGTLDDGRGFLVARSWIDEVFEGDGGGVFRQTYTVETWIADGDGGVLRAYAFWGEIDIGLTSVAMRDLVAESLLDGFERSDRFAADDDVAAYCMQDRERPYTRPEDVAGE